VSPRIALLGRAALASVAVLGSIVAAPAAGTAQDDPRICGIACQVNAADSDGDGLLDVAETITYGTDPSSADTDVDGITDDVEINPYGTDPNDWDTDGDFLEDNDEFVYGASPLVADSDGDSLSDGYEVYFLSTNASMDDSDHDGMGDGCDPQPKVPSGGEPFGCVGQG